MKTRLLLKLLHLKIELVAVEFSSTIKDMRLFQTRKFPIILQTTMAAACMLIMAH